MRNAMRGAAAILLAVSFVTVYAQGVNPGTGAPAEKPAVEQPAAAKPAPEKIICGKCGEIKGTVQCCQVLPNCTKCGLHMGSPGDCRMHAGDADAPLCPKCGEIKGSDGCCKEGAERCERCGLIKNAPACCRGTPADTPGAPMP